MEPIFLVEGANDKNVLLHLCIKQGIIKDEKGIRIDACQGLSDLLYKSLPVTLKSNPPVIGIIIDANSDLNKRWKTIKEILLKEGYQLPAVPVRIGTITKQDFHPTIGIWIMPDNQSNGMLEDFMKMMIPHDDKLLPVAEQTLDKIEKQELNRYPSNKQSKALVHTWLAWQNKPGLPYGSAIGEKYFYTDHELVTQFIDWVNRLFNN